MYTEVMIDIETLGKGADAVIVSIGACTFSLTDEAIGEKFYTTINPVDCQKRGLKIDADTVMWWMGQNAEAREALRASGAKLLPNALDDLTVFLTNTRNTVKGGKLNIWANDPNFDCTILENAFRVCDKALPWNYWETRSLRTMKMLGEWKGVNWKTDLKRDGAHHNALDDAIYQAQMVMKVEELIR